MSAQDLLLAHGEKALLFVAVVACGYYLHGTFVNPEIRPDNITAETINGMVVNVEKISREATPPVMKAPSAYYDGMIGRWTATLPSAKYYAWMSAAADVGPPDVQTSQYYIYQLYAPKISVVDTIGNLELTLSLPGSHSVASDVRMSDAANKTWSLSGREDNRAQWLGMQVEIKVGAGDWQPLAAKGLTNGLLPINESTPSYSLTIPTVEPWQRHSFRARLIAKATGLPLDQKKAENQQQTILVVRGIYADLAVDWVKLNQSIGDVVGGEKTVITAFQNGSLQGPFAGQLTPGERLYSSADSDEGSVLAQDSIRFVFEKLFQNPSAPEQSGASIMLSKFLRDPRAVGAKAGKWIEKPMSFKLLPGEGLGKPISIPNPFPPPGAKGGELVPEDFTTQYVLTEVKQKVPRIIFYEVYSESRPQGGKAKDLKFKPKSIETEVAILANTKTGSAMESPRCEKLTKPNKPLSFFYPDFSGLSYDEVAEFRKNPSNFKQNQLIPKEPIPHNPGTGPLDVEFKLKNDPLLQTDTVYYELPDGRLIYWDHFNNKVRVLIKAGSEAAADEKAAAAEVAAKAAAKAAVEAAAAAEAAAAGKDTKPHKDAKDAKDGKPGSKAIPAP